MARVAGVNIPDKKQAWISLTHIFGIGRTTALKICETTGIKFDTKISAEIFVSNLIPVVSQIFKAVVLPIPKICVNDIQACFLSGMFTPATLAIILASVCVFDQFCRLHKLCLFS